MCAVYLTCYQGPISWHCLPQNSALTEPCKAHESMGRKRNKYAVSRAMNLGPDLIMSTEQW